MWVVVKVRVGGVGPRKRAFIDEVVSRTRTNIRERIKLLTMDPGAYADSEGFRRAFMQQACAKERGLGLSGPEVAILFDVRKTVGKHLTDQRCGRRRFVNHMAA